MRQKPLARAISFMLVFALCLTVMPTVQQEAEAVSNMNDILNTVELHPQKTGYATLDNMIAAVLAPVANGTTAEKVQTCFDWCVQNINYSWAGYRVHSAAYDNFDQSAHPYPFDDYQDGLQQAIPTETINRVYYTMANRKGVCYDYAAVFTVMMRYIGLESYTHTGMYKFESWTSSSGGSGHHGWSVISINGTEYIFDPQREYRRCNDGTGTVNHLAFYGVRPGDTYYSHYNLTSDASANAARDASFLSVTAHREELVTVTGTASASGSVSGSGRYDIGTTATLTASSDSAGFQGWYDDSGNLLSADAAYSFSVTGATTVHALFAGDQFYDVPADAWYRSSAVRSGELGLISGVSPYCFSGGTNITRAMVVQILARLEGVDLNQYTSAPYSDVEQGQWYTSAIGWATEVGIVKGTSATTFEPHADVTREDYLLMLTRYLSWKNIPVSQADLPYSDTGDVDSWAIDAMRTAQGCGLLKGDNVGKCNPRASMSRAEGVEFITRLIDYIAANPAVEEQPTTDDTTDTPAQDTPDTTETPTQDTTVTTEPTETEGTDANPDAAEQAGESFAEESPANQSTTEAEEQSNSGDETSASTEENTELPAAA